MIAFHLLPARGQWTAGRATQSRVTSNVGRMSTIAVWRLREENPTDVNQSEDKTAENTPMCI
jgi:hypothetical protein